MEAGRSGCQPVVITPGMTTNRAFFRSLLKVKHALQQNRPIGGRRRKWPPKQSIGLPKERRTEIPNGIQHIHLVEDVLRVDTERQVVAVIRGTPTEHSPTTVFAAASSPWSAGPAAKRASSRATSSRGGFFLLAKTEGFAKPHVQSKPRRTGLLIDGNANLAGFCCLVKATIHSGFHTRTAARSYGRPRVERIDSVHVLSRGDVKRRP